MSIFVYGHVVDMGFFVLIPICFVPKDITVASLEFCSADFHLAGAYAVAGIAGYVHVTVFIDGNGYGFVVKIARCVNSPRPKR